MQDLIFSPKFVLEHMLNLSFNRSQVRLIQQLTGKAERTVYYWFSKGAMGKSSEYRGLMRKLSKNENCLWCPVNSGEFIRMVKDPTWGEFAAFWLLHKDNDFRLSMRFLLHNQFKNSNSKGWEGNLHRLSSCLPCENLASINDRLGKKGLTRDQIDNVIEVLAFIMVLALLESEYSEIVQNDSLFLGKILPHYINFEELLVSAPAELFIQQLLDSLIERCIFQDRAHFAEYIEKGTKLGSEHVLRYIDRYRAGEAVPLWVTFNNLAREIATRFFEIQDSRNGDEISLEERKKRIDAEIIHFQNLFGGALLLDGAFRFSHDLLARAGLDPVSFFRKEYLACAERMKNRGAAEPSPCG